MGLQKHSDHTKLFVGHGFTGCGKTRFWCHSERSEESLFDLNPMHREILRFAQNDKRTFSAACEVCATYLLSAVCLSSTAPPADRSRAISRTASAPTAAKHPTRTIAIGQLPLTCLIH